MGIHILYIRRSKNLSNTEWTDWKHIDAATWGNISGTLSNQTDLQAALDGKANTSHSHNYAPIPTSSKLPVGAMCVCRVYIPTGSTCFDIPNGGTVAGSLLRRVCPDSIAGGTLNGTWKNIYGATVNANSDPSSINRGGLFVRIA